MQRAQLFLRTMWAASPPLTIACALAQILEAVALPVVLWSSGQVVAGLVRGDVATVWIAALVASVVASAISEQLAQAAAARLQHEFVTHVVDQVAAVALRAPGLEMMERSDFRTPLQHVIDGTREWTFLTATTSAWMLVGMRLSGLSAFVVAAWWHPLPALLVVASWMVMSRFFDRWSDVAFNDMLEDVGEDRRRAEYLWSAATGRPAAFDLRIFGFGAWLLRDYESTWGTAFSRIAVIRRGAFLPIAAAGTGVLLANLVAYTWLWRDAWTGDVGTATALAAALALPQLIAFGMLGDVQTAVTRVGVLLVALQRLQQQVDDAIEAGGRTPAAGAVLEPEVRTAGIAVSDVFFTYPGNASSVLHGVTIDIAPGETVALVGDNGAGKSTLIKLLCGLYRPTSGTILVGGVDPTRSDARIGLMSQDFGRYPWGLRDNVHLAGADPQRWEHLADRPWFREIVRQVGEAEVLGESFGAGADLSEGQWQRVAAARALAVGGGTPDLLVFDEPTAALDVHTEIEVLADLLSRPAGVPTLLVTHRLASVALADRLIVLEGGRITQQGTHAELASRPGWYADALRVQSRRLDETASNDVGGGDR